MEAYFLEALKKHDIPIPKTAVTNRRMERWGDNNKYWAKEVGGGYVFGDFSRDLSTSVFKDKLDKKTRELKIESARKDIERELAKQQNQAALKAMAMFNSARECREHPYLEKKRIKSFGLKIHESKLIIPILDIDGRLTSLQTISIDGEKRLFKGGRIKGCFFPIGNWEKAESIIICEGYATGATLFDIVHKPVIIAFNAGNLKSVGVEIRKKYPDKKIIFAADNDQFKSVNIGIEKAREAAAEIQGEIVIPEFEKVDSKPTDFNDLYILEGQEKVLECFLKTDHDLYLLRDFTLSEYGLFVKDNRNKLTFVSGYIKVLAHTREFYTGFCGVLVEFKDRTTGKIQKMKISTDWFANAGEMLRTQLRRRGLLISPSSLAKAKFNEYIIFSDPKETFVYFDESGWKDDLFVLGPEIIGDIKINAISGINDEAISCEGTLDEWQMHIAKYCEGNSRLLFSVCTAFASVLVKICDIQNCGFNLVGESSIGKTTCLKVAASVFGPHDYINAWRATDNGLENLAMKRNDLLLILDEMGQVDPSKIGEIAYMLANGQGKARLDRECNTKEIKKWRLLFLSTGEIELATHMSESKKTTRAGQEIRLINIPARPYHESYGIFEKLHEFKNGELFSEYLSNATRKYYGTPGREFIKKVIQKKDKIKNDFESRLQQLRELYLNKRAQEQDRRAFKTFAFIIFAGELATELKITGWTTQIHSFMVSCFNDWLFHKGGFGNQEEKAMLEKVKTFFELHSQSRFQQLHRDEYTVYNMAGYKRVDDRGSLFYVFPTVFKKEICSGFDHKAVIKLLIAKDILQSDDHGRCYFQKKFFNRNMRVYVIAEEALHDS